MDNKSPSERSENMRAVHSRNTGPELRLRKALWAKGIRYFTADGWSRLSGVRLPGSPDLVIPSVKLAVFVDGCFWHGCPLHYEAPQSRADFWAKKLSDNKARDATVNKELEQLGWTVLRIWEHSLRPSKLPATVDQVVCTINHMKNARYPCRAAGK